MKKQVIYFIEYRETIKFFGENGNTFDMIKNETTYELLQRTLKKNKYFFKNLLTN